MLLQNGKAGTQFLIEQVPQRTEIVGADVRSGQNSDARRFQQGEIVAAEIRSLLAVSGIDSGDPAAAVVSQDADHFREIGRVLVAAQQQGAGRIAPPVNPERLPGGAHFYALFKQGQQRLHPAVILIIDQIAKGRIGMAQSRGLHRPGERPGFNGRCRAGSIGLYAIGQGHRPAAHLVEAGAFAFFQRFPLGA